jgi:hypothetical protein
MKEVRAGVLARSLRANDTRYADFGTGQIEGSRALRMRSYDGEGVDGYESLYLMGGKLAWRSGQFFIRSGTFGRKVEKRLLYPLVTQK